MKKRKSAAKNGKENDVNNTPHQRAMANPEVQELISALRAESEKLSPRQQGERAIKLLDLGCSTRGIARETGIKESTLRRHITLAKSVESEDDCAKLLRGIIGKKPQEKPEMSRLDVARHQRSLIPAREMGPVKKSMPLGTNPVHPSTTQRANTMPAPQSVRVKIDADNALDEKKIGEDQPKMSPLELWKLTRGPMTPEKMRLLDEMSKSMQRPQFRDARSMKRQGKPVPPSDDI